MTAAAVRLRRLFFALWPEPATRDALHRETRAVALHAGGRPVPAADLHLTLDFLGNVPDERVPAITTATAALQLPRFEFALDCYGWFDGAQVLWIGCSRPPAALARLAAELARLMSGAAALAPDARPFHPHVTLARKVRNPPELRPPRPVAWPVEGFALVESTTDPQGARFRVVAEFPTQSPPTPA